MIIEDYIKDIYNKGYVIDNLGDRHSVELASISKEEGAFISEIIKSNPNIQRTIEVGCAYGMSSLFICSALLFKNSKHHTIIDPNQSSQYKNLGISNLKNVNVDFFELIEEPSELALPNLLRSKKKYDFGFIDGWHTFDHTLIDFFYLNRLISVGGIIVIDDITYPSINKLTGYLTQYPCYEVIGTVEFKSIKKKILRLFMLPFKIISSVLPYKISIRIFNGGIFLRNKKYRNNTSMIALKKIKDDERNYDWFEKF